MLRARNFSTLRPLLNSQTAKVAASEAPSFTWTDYFSLRKQQRAINLGSGGFTALIGANVSWAVLSTMPIDPTQMIFGVDPLFVISAGILASSGLGFLCGPAIGNLIFKAKNGSKLQVFEEKDKVFLEHVIANRVDASRQSFSNPVPDYYGEKIGSLREYRQWLRDCHAYRTKAQDFV